ncbi:Lipase member H [Frankliniella fusca]|uniref:Lipase member H n=3 Tax=Arthropoda TaxID=6656 RepID=A0AAE1LR23_9NEOP|nr:Lipase member H [Frankliniella fusca]
MAKSLSLLVSAVAVLLQLGSAAVLDQQKLAAQQLSAQNLLSQKMYGHLQVEIDEWNRLGYPDVLHFNDGDAGARITEMPLLTSMLFPNYEKGTKFYLYTRDNRNGTKVGTTPTAKDFLEAGFSAGRPTKIVAHGWGNNIDSTIFQEVVPSLLDNDDYNVIAIDWGELAKMPLYIESRNHVAGVGKQVAKAVDELVANGGLNLKDTHCLGHSLGAHVCGNTGKNVQSGKLNRITGLDPAMPLFLVLKNDRLGKGDAELVDVIHTCAGLLGIVEAIGDVDFYPNGGSLPQPGCESELLASSCSHSRSFEYMAESAREPGSFPAYECDSSSEARRGDCAGDLVANMGLNLNYDGPGSYYLKTADSAPFDIQTHLRVEASKKVEG